MAGPSWSLALLSRSHVSLAITPLRSSLLVALSPVLGMELYAPLPSLQTSLTVIEHFDHPNLPSRVQPQCQPWSAHLHRRGYYCLWDTDRILDRLWRIIQHERRFPWRFPIAFQIVFGIILVIGAFFLPESPRWLLSRDRHEEGQAVLSALYGLPEDHQEIQLQKTIILDSIAASGHKGGKTSYSALFTNGKTQHFRRMVLGCSSQFFQQIGGCNAVVYYCPILFQTSLGADHSLAMLLGGVNMIVYSIFATMSWFIIERAGRRKLFLIGSAGQGLSMVLVFACLIPGTKSAANGAAVGLFTYIAFFGATWLPLPWLYPAEINPIRTRGRANAVSTAVNWVSNFMIVCHLSSTFLHCNLY